MVLPPIVQFISCYKDTLFTTKRNTEYVVAFTMMEGAVKRPDTGRNLYNGTIKINEEVWFGVWFEHFSNNVEWLAENPDAPFKINPCVSEMAWYKLPPGCVGDIVHRCYMDVDVKYLPKTLLQNGVWAQHERLITNVFQWCLRAQFPTDADSSLFSAVVLTRKHRESPLPKNVPSTDLGVYANCVSVGLHVVTPRCGVTYEVWQRTVQGTQLVLQRIEEKTRGIRAGPMELIPWEAIIDETKALRMPYASKFDRETKEHDNNPYVPAYTLTLSQTPDEGLWGEVSRSVLDAVRLCTVHWPWCDPPTPGCGEGVGAVDIKNIVCSATSNIVELPPAKEAGGKNKKKVDAKPIPVTDAVAVRFLGIVRQISPLFWDLVFKKVTLSDNVIMGYPEDRDPKYPCLNNEGQPHRNAGIYFVGTSGGNVFQKCMCHCPLTPTNKRTYNKPCNKVEVSNETVKLPADMVMELFKLRPGIRRELHAKLRELSQPYTLVVNITDELVKAQQVYDMSKGDIKYEGKPSCITVCSMPAPTSHPLLRSHAVVSSGAIVRVDEDVF